MVTNSTTLSSDRQQYYPILLLAFDMSVNYVASKYLETSQQIPIFEIEGPMVTVILCIPALCSHKALQFSWTTHPLPIVWARPSMRQFR